MTLGFSRTRLSFDRKLTSYSKVQWLVTKVRRNIRLFDAAISPGSYFNVGCGPNIRPGFVNVDADWRPGVDLCCDISVGLPVPDAVAGGVYTEHCLEHLPLSGAKAFLTDCHRVMAPDSCIRIVVPDLEMYARSYVASLDGAAPTMPNEYFVNHTNVNLPVALINELFYGPDHRFIYDFQALGEVLQQAGFSDIEKRSFRIGSDERLLIDDAGHISESLYVEAIKR
ncbi:MAG: hypothetical protein NTV97_22555 [Alphaproteobacteria bacterium]|nr:hypothetical protein [Alphaproteobacteria bacterium]